MCCMKPVLFTAVLLRCFLSDCGLIFVYLDLSPYSLIGIVGEAGSGAIGS